ncbi:MAG: hypothetical protein HY801_00375 [Candidatus Lindowbacteria bacterium]|nr:hypothetical protein [Candidatus Lindowbacteria bacterium]
MRRWSLLSAITFSLALLTAFPNSAYSTEPCEIYLPLLVGSVDTVGYAEGVAVSGSYAYVAADFSGLQVVDISDSDTPVIVAAVDTPSYGAQDVAISGSLACVADFDLGLQVRACHRRIGRHARPGFRRGGFRRVRLCGGLSLGSSSGGPIEAFQTSDRGFRRSARSC